MGDVLWLFGTQSHSYIQQGLFVRSAFLSVIANTIGQLYAVRMHVVTIMDYKSVESLSRVGNVIFTLPY